MNTRWGTDKAKLAAIDDEDVCAWLKSRSLLALVAPLRELTHELNTLLKPECNATTANVPIETVKSYLASHSESRKNDPRFVAAVAEVCLRHAHKVATPEPEAGTDAAPPTSNFAVEKKSLEKWLVALVKPLIVAPEERALTTRLQLEVLFTVQHLCSGGAKPPSSATFKCDDTYCRRVFELLYELEVVDEESFLAWEREETRMRDTKEVMMVRGARDFLEWLRTADE